MRNENDWTTGALTTGMSSLDRRLHDDSVREYATRFRSRVQSTHPASASPNATGQAVEIAEYLQIEIQALLTRIEELRSREADFSNRYAEVQSESERRECILEFVGQMGTGASDIRYDRRAFRRWFGDDTAVERCHRRICEAEYKLTFVVGRLGAVAAVALGRAADQEGTRALWQRLNLEQSVKPLLEYQGDARVRTEAFQCLVTAVTSRGNGISQPILAAETLTIIHDTAADARQDIWTQCEALNLLLAADTDRFVGVLTERLGSVHDGDDIFFRRHAIRTVERNPEFLNRLTDPLSNVLNDPSPFVRQALAGAVRQAMLGKPQAHLQDRAASWLHAICLDDEAPQVRAAGILEMPRLLAEPVHIQLIQSLFVSILSRETDSFVLRTALKAACDGLTHLLKDASRNEALRFHEALLPLIEELHQHAHDLSVRRWAAMSRERMLVAINQDAQRLKEHLEQALRDLKPGQAHWFPRSLPGTADEETLGRILSVMSQEDFCYSVTYDSKGFRITRGDVFGFRLWRFVHELRSPRPDKRLGYDHLHGRHTPAEVRAPSAIGSEMTVTKVPGEPLRMETESGWRPYLPLVDDMISCLQGVRKNRVLRIYTAEGLTEVTAPRSLATRLRAFLSLTLQFPTYAQSRNWSEAGPSSAREYVKMLENLGFQVCHEGYGNTQGNEGQDSAVTRFFGLSVPFLGNEPWQSAANYIASANQNTLFDLGVFSGALLATFIGRRAYMNWAVKRARRSLRLVIGGWGTSGKSSVERLKAALFEALGHGLVSKTTGSTAMFLHAYPFGKAREMHLYRSNDKVTIWEHHSLMLMAQRLKAKVFLWECMGLTPAFVKILQRQWGRDDYSTITNTYPDHEDVQGPAGIDVPQAMTEFVPKNGVLITSEEEMKPVLEQATRELGSEMKSIGWLEAGLLTPDVLQRFPYEEHPYNVSIVLELAKELGIEPDFALKEIADRVVPDIGVLKVYPRAHVRGRVLQFVSGMAANERLSTTGNWERAGFDTSDSVRNPDVYVCGLINNRADRTYRSTMFADILVNDLRADRYFLMGSNLPGLIECIKRAWDRFMERIHLYGDQGDNRQGPKAVFDGIARRLRIPMSEEHVRQRLHAMMEGLGKTLNEDDLAFLIGHPDAAAEKLTSYDLHTYSDDIATYLRDQISKYREFEDFRDRLEDRNPRRADSLEPEFRELAGRWFMSRFSVIEDPNTTGEQVIDHISRETPPGLFVRIMGMQNIKGVGLDFLSCWQSWETCHGKYSELLGETDPERFHELLHQMTTFREYGLLSEDFMQRVLTGLREHALAGGEPCQAKLSLIEDNVRSAREVRNSALELSKRRGFLPRLVEAIEGFLDVWDAVLRRRAADRIYDDLIDERISHERAAEELKRLTVRQDSGWLAARLGL